MALSNDLASSPSSGNSPASLDSLPNTPLTPNAPVQMLSLPASDSAANAPSQPANAGKRKPSRRANTAERRATHNAVERQRRETLNGRFLDLAALLPNLSQIRRPSKSAIVNSSIAHIHSSRRHRTMASRELRLLKLEADALRRELNEWRDRANLPRVEEPVRSDAFGLVLSGEVEMLPVITSMDDEDEDQVDDDMGATTPIDDNEANYLNKGFVPQINALSRAASLRGPMIASGVSGIAYENPAVPAAQQQQQVYEPSLYQQQPQQQIQHQYALFDDKNAWSTQLLAAQQQIQYQQQQQQQAGYITPPSTSHGYAGTPPASGYGTPPAFFANAGHLYGSPVDDTDSSSVGSVGSVRTRSDSMNGGVQPSFERLSGGASYATAFPLMM